MQDIYIPNSDTWIYEEFGVIIRFISMSKNEIGGLFISPNYRSKGIGNSLLEHTLKFHKELEVEVFSENKIGNPFYEKLGFKIIKEYLHQESNQKVLRMFFKADKNNIKSAS